MVNITLVSGISVLMLLLQYCNVFPGGNISSVNMKTSYSCIFKESFTFNQDPTEVRIVGESQE